MNEKKGKVFDEKGRLFGKINIIDVIVLLLIVVVAVFLALKFTGKSKGMPGEAQTSQIEYSAIVYRVTPEVYQSVAAEVALGGEHAQLMADGAMLANSQVLSVRSQPHMEGVSLDDGTIVMAQEGSYVDVIVEMRAEIQNSITQKVGTQEVRIGKSHIIKTRTFELVNGIILTCEPVVATPAA